MGRVDQTPISDDSNCTANKRRSKMHLFVVIFALLVPYVASDTPGNCSYEEITGQWEFSVSGGGGDKTVNCTNPGQ